MKYQLAILLSIGCFAFGQEIKSSLKTAIKKEINVNYLLQLPKDVKNDSIALLVFLHGSGERGTNLELVKANGPFKYQHLLKEPTAILAPQCPENVWWDTEAIYQLIKDISSKYKVKKNKIYITGLSMGGWGTLKLYVEHPELFAKVASVCAPVDDLFVVSAEYLKNKPVKIFHGALDNVVPVQHAINFFTELKKTNSQAELIIFENDNHNSWDSAYSDPTFYQWLAKH